MQRGRLIAFAVVTASLGSACTSPRTNMSAKAPMVDAMTDGKLKVVPARITDTREGEKNESVPKPKPWKIGDVIIQPASPGKNADYLLEPKPLNIPREKAKPRL